MSHLDIGDLRCWKITWKLVDMDFMLLKRSLFLAHLNVHHNLFMGVKKKLEILKEVVLSSTTSIFTSMEPLLNQI